MERWTFSNKCTEGDNARSNSSQDRCLPHPAISLSQQLCMTCHHTCFNEKRTPRDLVPTRLSTPSDSPLLQHLLSIPDSVLQEEEENAENVSSSVINDVPSL